MALLYTNNIYKQETYHSRVPFPALSPPTAYFHQTLRQQKS